MAKIEFLGRFSKDFFLQKWKETWEFGRMSLIICDYIIVVLILQMFIFL